MPFYLFQLHIHGNYSQDTLQVTLAFVAPPEVTLSVSTRNYDVSTSSSCGNISQMRTIYGMFPIMHKHICVCVLDLCRNIALNKDFLWSLVLKFLSLLLYSINHISYCQPNDDVHHHYNLYKIIIIIIINVIRIVSRPYGGMYYCGGVLFFCLLSFRKNIFFKGTWKVHS